MPVGHLFVDLSKNWPAQTKNKLSFAHYNVRQVGGSGQSMWKIQASY